MVVTPISPARRSVVSSLAATVMMTTILARITIVVTPTQSRCNEHRYSIVTLRPVSADGICVPYLWPSL